MGELEAQALDVLWDRGGWLTPGEVHEVLSAKRRLAYTTVMTILVRLWQKGLLERHRDGRAYVYQPVETREQTVARHMREVLAGTPDSTAALAQFLQTISAKERAQLRRMLKRR